MTKIERVGRVIDTSATGSGRRCGALPKLDLPSYSWAMQHRIAPADKPARKRGQGRPTPGENDVGRGQILDATEKLLRIMPPARVTIARIVEEANVDRALVRYYFGNRTNLLVAVVDRVTAHTQLMAQLGGQDVSLPDHIAKTVRFVRSAPFMHRLMVDELVREGTAATRQTVRAMNLDLVSYYRDLLEEDAGKRFVETDPILLHLAILGICDFFVSSEPLIRELVSSDDAARELSTKFRPFVTDLILNGIRKR